MKIAIIVGHNEDEAEGAVAPRPVDSSEFDFNSLVAAAMLRKVRAKAYAGLQLKVFKRKDVGGYTAQINQVYKEVDDWGADASIELHFNAATPGATGTETLCSGSSRSKKLANALQNAMLKMLGLRDRGVKVRTTGRGARSLLAGRAPAALVEPFFCTNRSDNQTAADLGVNGFADMYLQGLKAYAES